MHNSRNIDSKPFMSWFNSGQTEICFLGKEPHIELVVESFPKFYMGSPIQCAGRRTLKPLVFETNEPLFDLRRPLLEPINMLLHTSFGTLFLKGTFNNVEMVHNLNTSKKEYLSTFTAYSFIML